MSLRAELRALVVKGWSFWLRDGNLAYRAVKDEFTETVLKRLQSSKTEIIELLQQDPMCLMVAPASDGQRFYWIEWQRNPSDASANIPYSVSFKSRINIAYFHQAINAVIARHEALRTFFVFESGNLLQQILPVEKASIKIKQVRFVGSNDRLRRRLIRDHSESFALDRKPPLRMTVYTRDDTDHTMLLSIHHSIIDGLSHGIVLEEFLSNYNALCRGETITALPVSATYRDFAFWQRRLIGSDRWRKMEDYWLDELEGAPTVLTLPQNQAAGLATTSQAGVVNITLGEDIYRALDVFTRRFGVTKYIVLMSVFQALLSRYSGQNDVLIGTPMLGRNDQRFATVVGYFINTVVLRATIDKGTPFSALIGQTNRKTLAAIENQDYLFSSLVEKLNPIRKENITPIFQAWFNLNKYWRFRQVNKKVDAFKNAEQGLSIELFDIGGQEANFDLVLQILDDDRQFRSEFKFNATRYDVSMISDMASDFSTLLKSLFAEPDIVIENIKLKLDKHTIADSMLEKAYRLSVQQQRAYTQMSVDWRRPSYCIAKATNGVNIVKLRRAVERVTERHEIHKVCFVRHPSVDGLLQTIGNESGEWHTLPCLETDADLTEKQILAHVSTNRDCASVFDNSSLIRWFTFNVADKGLVLVGEFHPLCTDLQSLNALMADIDNCYEALQDKGSWEVEDPIQYLDYSAWNHEYLSSDAAKETRNFWDENLPVRPPRSNWRLDRLGTSITRFCPELATSWSVSLQELTNSKVSSKIETEVLLVSAWQAFLSRLNGQEAVPISVLFDGRTDENMSSMSGPLARFIPLAFALDLNSNLESQAKRNQARILAVEELQHAFDWALRSKFRTLALPYAFEFVQKSPNHRSIEPFTVVAHPERFNLKLSVSLHPSRDHFQCDLYSNTFAIESSDVQSLASNFQAFLNDCIRNPLLPLAGHTMCDSAELKRMLTMHPSGPNVTDLAVHDQVLRNAERFGEKIAIKCQYHQFTYAELPAAVAALQEQLLRANVRPGNCVAVYAYHSSYAVLAMLAIWSVGGIYVPIDPEHPVERLQFIVDDCGPACILADPACPALSLTGVESTISMNIEGGVGSSLATMNVDCKNAAYIIYTSGSTGQPKGAIISHKALADHIASACSRFETTEDDNVLLFAPLNFDPSIEQALVPLVSGARVTVRGQVVWPPFEMVEKVNELGITVLNVPTAYWHFMVQEWASLPDLNALGSLRLVIVGGDKMEPDRVRDWWALGFESTRLVNAYGPTETTITASTAELSEPDDISLNQVPIGKPLSNRSMHVLDPMGQPLPPGSVGELHIAGIGLADGYLNRNELSASCFIPNKLAFRENDRLYKTGDLAFTDQQGNFYFAGRKDSQVKIRGFRVEPLEIEHCANRFPGLQYAVVGVRRKGSDANEKMLVLYYVPKDGQDIEEPLRMHFRSSLPEYMQIDKYVTLNELPLTASGKVNRKALDKIPLGKHIKNKFLPPQTPTEIALSKVWCEVLSVEKIGRTNNFSELGGHSLLSMKLLAAITERFAVELTLKDIFRLNQLSEQAELIDSLLESDEKSSISEIPRVPRDQPLPASFAQESMWVLSKFGLSDSYQMSGYLRYSKPLDFNVLRASATLIMERHEVLRTAFQEVDGQLFQKIGEVEKLDFEFLNNIARGSVDDELRRWHRQAFDLTKAPLIKLILIREENGCDTLGVSVHHIICDGISIGIMLSELANIYESLRKGVSVTLPELPIQYADYALWQRELLSKSFPSEDLDYWKKHLDGYQDFEVLALADNVQSPLVEDKRLLWDIPKELDANLSSYACSLGISPTAIYVGCVKLVLEQYTENKNFCIGLPTSNRSRSEFERLLGMLVNILVIRVGVATDRQLKSAYFKHIHEAIQTGLVHQNIPFEKIVQGLNPKRDGKKNPLFQVFVSYVEGIGQVEFGDNVASFERIECTQSRFFLAFDFERNALGQLTLSLEFDAELFNRARVDDIKLNLEHLFGQLEKDYDSSIEELSLVCPQQIRRMQKWGSGPILPAVDPNNFSVLDLISEQSTESAERPALTCSGNTLNYQKLDQRIGAVAGYLQAGGVGKGQAVIVSIKRSLNTAVAMLAILRIGAIYVPIDAELPEQRVRYILEDSGAKVILADQHTSEKFNRMFEPIEARIIDLDSLKRSVSPLEKLVLTEGSADRTAYIIYTSGSTGKPKGVAVSLASVTHCIYAMRDVVSFASDDRMLAVASTSFDISMLDLLLPLCFGGELIIAEENCIKNPELLAEMFSASKATIAQATPTQWDLLFNTGWENPADCRLLSIGEPVSDKLHRRFRRYASHAWNGYGPTEATIYATSKYITDHSCSSIGGPIGNYTVYVLNDQLQWLPPGVPGELYIGGPGVAQGYHNQRSLTDSVFLQSPFCLNERIYKTGDIVRWVEQEESLELEYLFRRDSQVKLRGHRIELGEIEAAIDEARTVKQVAVGISRVNNVDSLVAYLVPSDEWRHSCLEELKKGLIAQLPPYMVPSYYQVLERLPQTASNKLDRKALAALPMQEVVSEYSSLASEEVQRLHSLWCSLFNVSSLAITENFFELGGHSLLLIQLQNRINNEFGVKVSLEELFSNPSIESMARLLAQKIKIVEPVKEASICEDASLPSFNQQGLWLVNHAAGGTSAYNIVACLKIEGQLDRSLLLQTWQTIQRRHSSLRSRFYFEDGQLHQALDSNLLSELPETDLRKASEEDKKAAIASAIEIEFDYVFDLAKGNLIRLHLLAEAENENIFILNIHHIVVDGWSMRLLIQETLEIYNALKERRSVLLPEPRQYSDFARWQRQWIAGNEFGHDVHYWKNKLAGSSFLSALPYDYDVRRQTTSDGKYLTLSLTSSQTDSLRSLASSLETTLFNILLSCWKCVLYVETNSTDIVIGTDVANRRLFEHESVVGLCMNQVPLRTIFDEDCDMARFVALVGQTCIEAFDHQSLPFELLVSKLNVERKDGRSPIFQCKVFMDSIPNNILKGGSLSIEPVEIGRESARLDLNCSLVDRCTHIDLRLIYRPDLFAPYTIKRMLRLYERALMLISLNLDLSISRFSEQLRADYQMKMKLDKQSVRDKKTYRGQAAARIQR